MVLLYTKSGDFMTYFDYSATTMVDDEVLDCFVSNFGIEEDSFLLEEESNKIKSLLHTDLDVLYTSGASESNNWVLKNIVLNSKVGSHIITTKLEHSSINETLKFLEKKGYVIDYVPLVNGVVDLVSLEKMITNDTVLVSIASVNSEVGVLQPILEIGNLLKKYPWVYFHSDMTQSIGKVNIDLSSVDFVSFSAHKFFGIKGIGCLLKRKDIELEPYFYGERKYSYALVRSMVVALTKALDGIDEKNRYVSSLKKKLVKGLDKYPLITVNSGSNSIPQIVNISVKNFKPEVFLHTLELDDIYISTKSACSSSSSFSEAVFAVTKSEELSSCSVRISLSYKTLESDIDYFLSVIDKIMGGD